MVSLDIAQVGRYAVVRSLGQGAMGRVLLAHDPVLDRDVAVKLLRDDLGISDDQQGALFERMRQEARASARVSHPNIVALHDMGEDTHLGLYLVFEYVEGPSLKDRVQRGGMGPEAAAVLAQQLGDALSTAHTTGVLHRDIKPENVIMAKTGAKIADFGIARVPDSTLTRDGGLLGTPAYSAPESISEGRFSPKSDQFSLAATLYEVISLHRAFPGEDAVTVATRIQNEEPAPVARLCGLDPHVDTVLARALSKNPKGRFASCEEFGRALAEALRVTPRAQMPTFPDAKHQRAAELRLGARSVRIALGGAAIGTLVTLGALSLTEELRRPPRPRAELRAIAQSKGPAATGWLAPATTSTPGVPRVPADAGVRSAHPQKTTDASAAEGGAGDLPVPAPSRAPSLAASGRPATAATGGGSGPL